MKASKTCFQIIIAAFFAAQLSACAHKKVAGDAGVSGSGDPTVMDSTISSQPLGLDASGSDSGNIEGLHTVHFEFDRSVVIASERELLGQNAQWMKNHPSLTLQIEGHCDARGSVEYNLALGERRAKAVMNELKALGVPASRMTVISFGEERPVAAGDSEEAYAKSRRANFVPLDAPVNQLSAN